MNESSVHGIKSCYGCGICALSCPKSCISFKRSDQGFFIPDIFAPNCIHCGLCKRICPVLSPDSLDKMFFSSQCRGYAAWLKDDDLLQKCSSGGVIKAIALALSEDNFHFCGVRYSSERLQAEHFCATSLKDFEDADGSKYLQSATLPAFQNFQKKDCKWMVIGTPCQIAGLRRWICDNDSENRFLLVDFWCHGVPSYKLWEAFLKVTCKGHDPYTTKATWRGKTKGWQNSYELRLTDKDGCFFSGFAKDNEHFFHHFLRRTVQNRVCYSCPFTGIRSAADIRVGDYWGKQYANNQTGVSKVIVFTDVGQTAWDKACIHCVTKINSDKELSDLKSHSRPPSEIPSERELFLKILSWPYGFYLAHYCSPILRLCNKISRFIGWRTGRN